MPKPFRHNKFGISPDFIAAMENRMRVSHYKYGPLENNYPFPVNAIDSLKARLAQYLEDGNIEWLIDVANFAMIEALYPAHMSAHYDPVVESIGLVKDES